MGARTKPALAAAATGLLVLLLAGWADRHAGSGLSAEWRQTREGRTHVVARTIEHRTTFPNEHRALARYVQSWPFERWDVPDHLPDLNARLAGTLDVPPGPARRLEVHSPNRVRLRVDGEAFVPGHRIAPGTHRVRIHWEGRFEPEASLELRWAARGAPAETVPSTAFTPAGGPWTPARGSLWVVAGLLALGLGLLACRAASAAAVRARRRRWGALAAIVVVLLALGYRAFDYPVMPEFRENHDELFATWNGWSLLAEGTPRGWSLWAGRYAWRDDTEIIPVQYFTKRALDVVEPYFEHPPLMHLLVGAAAHLGGAAHWTHARLVHTRLVPILLGGLTTLLIIAVGRRLRSTREASTPYLGALLYAVLPMIALQGRVIKEEALLAPMALGSLLFFLRWRDDGERTADLVGAAVLAGASALAKVPGLVFLGALVLLVLQHRRPREATIALGVGLLSATPLLVYAAAIDWDAFWFATQHQATGRPSHFNLFPRFFDDPLINHNLVGRPWLLFLWLGWAIALRSFAPGDRAVLVVPPLVYLVGIGLPSGNWTFGWYLMPVYPFLCLGAGRFLAELWERPDLLRGTLFVTLAVMYGVSFLQPLDAWRDPEAWPHTRRIVSIFVTVALAPYALAQVSRARPVRALARLATAAGLIALVGLSGRFVVHYDTIYETHRNFDRLEFFDR
ncbi:MAG: ArnT family glycosyltransferase [Myxococcota bacterium]